MTRQVDTSNRSLMPREHGATAELAYALVTGLVLGRFCQAALLLGAAFTLVFVAHEPVLVLLGRRGSRAKRDAGPKARRWLIGLVLAATLFAWAGAYFAPEDARRWILLPAGAGVVGAALVAVRREKTAFGELAIVVALMSTVVPMGLAGGAARMPVMAAWLEWCAVFSIGTLAVRAVRHEAKDAARWAASALSIVCGTLAAWFVVQGVLPALAAFALLPPAMLAFALAILRVSARHLRRLGFALVGISFVSAVCLLAGLRGEL